MKISYGKSRIFWYTAIGGAAGALIVLAHELLQAFISQLHLLFVLPFIIVLAIGMGLLARTENKLYNRISRLEAARDRVNQLMLGAVGERKRPTMFIDEILSTCYEELGCEKEDCPAFGVEHARCWLIAGTFCRGEVQGQFAKKLNDCRLCEVYKKATVDPVDEITENFYAMNYLLGEREEQIEKAYQEARIKSEKLAGLVSMSGVALSSVHLTDILRNLLESSASLVGADAGFVSLVDVAGEQLIPRMSIGIPPADVPRLTEEVGHDIVGNAFAGLFMAISTDLANDSRQENIHLKSLGIRTLISLPLITGEDPIGMLTLGTFTAHHYTEEEKDSLSVAADRIALAVENSRLAGEVGREREQTQLIQAISSEAGAADGIASFYQSFVEHAAQVIDFDQANLCLWDAEHGQIEIVAVQTKAPRTWLSKGLVLPKESMACSIVIDSAKPLIRDSISDEYATDKLIAEEGIRSAILFPLLSKDEVVAVLHFGSFKEHAFNQDDVELLEPVTRQLGMVVDNIRIQQEAERSSLVDRLTGLYSHRFLYDGLKREVAVGKRHNRSVSLMIVRVNGIARLNERSGRSSSDLLLKRVGEQIKSAVRAIDIVARYGGIEFGVLLPELDSSNTELLGGEIAKVGARIRDRIISEVFETGEWSAAALSLNIGIALLPLHAQDAETLMEKADAALRESRARGEGYISMAIADRAGAADFDDRGKRAGKNGWGGGTHIPDQQSGGKD